ncbi:MAG: hypothetical protein LKH93_15895 [Clostridium beijerinckii]|nr:hypothetical protein [Clostridium beijerinckii]MCI1583477.1 hypothetical protein [Clostridium beijerinckii]MCI1623683.1 hypothetical protein [Clostridium beijerinckii]
MLNREYLEEKELKDSKEKVTDLTEGSDKINYKYKLTNEKLIYMIKRFITDGFTTFWQ